ncbi:MAG: NAD(P)-dependent alcohol dehydrogenase [Actinomycetota bacterium]|nr:NAD(P)-dependent alcohol dehydrogenase [Actinomycetota bacterium]
MRAIVQDGYGRAERWRLTEIARPGIANTEVLLNVHAAGIDRGTWHAMTGLPYLGRLYFGLRKPKRSVPGLDVAGTVVAIGAEVSRFTVGDEVFGIGRGSFAEYARAREDKLVPKPANVTFEQAAVVAVSGLTALQSLRDAGRVKQGQHVLIIGASGGVGTFAVQIAKSFGAEVTGVCSTAKADLVSSIGADHVIDYTQSDFTDGPQRYDLILDIGGNTPLSRLRRVLTPRGTLVIVGGEESGRWTGLSRQLRALALSPFVRQRLTIRVPKETHVDIGRLAELIESGQLSPVIDRSYPLADAADAMRHLEAGHARGKIAIAVRADADPPGA